MQGDGDGLARVLHLPAGRGLQLAVLELVHHATDDLALLRALLLRHLRPPPPRRGEVPPAPPLRQRGGRRKAAAAGRDQRPVKVGRRFSSMAFTASLWSSVLWARAW